MLSKLEQAIKNKTLPVVLDNIFCVDIYLELKIVEDGFWLGYEGEGHAGLGPPDRCLADYSKTIDEAVDKLIPLVAEAQKTAEVEENNEV
jgi:hypothetical protein